MSKRNLLTAAALVAALALGSTASARAESAPAADSSMSGVYLGGYGGFDWTNAGPFGVNGGDYGVFAGYQIDSLLDRTNMGLTGAIEAMYGWSNADDTRGTARLEKRQEWGVDFRPGLSFMSSSTPFGLRPYGILGYRNAEFRNSVPAGTNQDTFHGFELGIGTELVAYKNFGVRLDYAHVFYGSQNGLEPKEDDLRGGVVLHF